MHNVMIVDDSPVVRKIIRLALEGPNLHAVESGDGIEALESLAKGSPDLFIIDVNMPRMDGLELVRRLRKEKTLKDVPVIMLSTEGSEEDRRRGYDAGVTVYLSKPVSPTLLKYKVESMLIADSSTPLGTVSGGDIDE